MRCDDMARCATATISPSLPPSLTPSLPLFRFSLSAPIFLRPLFVRCISLSIPRSLSLPLSRPLSLPLDLSRSLYCKGDSSDGNGDAESSLPSSCSATLLFFTTHPSSPLTNWSAMDSWKPSRNWSGWPASPPILSARELHLILVYFSQDGLNSWSALKLFDWLRKENRANNETGELMVTIMCGWVEKMVRGEHAVEEACSRTWSVSASHPGST
ncbi:hypothetical protein ACLOJK_011490 [Asimina triloba]